MTRFILLISFLFLGSFSNAQIKLDSNQELAFYCDIMINADDPSHREFGQEKFNTLLSNELNQEGAYVKDFSFLKWIPILENSDQTFKIYSWELKLEDGKYKQFGFIHMKDGSIHTLTSEGNDLEDISYEFISTEDWYGAMYYKLEEFTSKGEKLYMLFGRRSYSKFNTLKIADVLTFEENVPSFGKEIFKLSGDGTRGDIKTRLILNYSADANVSLNYNPDLEMIVHDHLIARMGRMPGQGPTQLPDGSYVGWKLKDGMWNYVEKIYDQKLDEAPRPNPILDGRKGSSISGKRGK